MEKKVSSILLIQPWIEDFYFTDCRIQPIGLAYLTAAVKIKHPDLNVAIYDALAGGEKKSIPLPDEFKYLKRYYGFADKSSFRLFNQYYRFGKNLVRIKKDLAHHQPFLIGISSLFTPYYRQSLVMAEICRGLFPEVPIVMGGNHATLHPESLLKAKKNNQYLCDFVIRQEAEEGVCELIEALQGNRPFRSVSNLIIREELDEKLNISDDSFTFNIHDDAKSKNDMDDPVDLIPDLTGLDLNEYQFNQRPMSFLITARSCPHRCSFCSIHAVFGKKFRVRSPDSVLEEIRLRFFDGIRHIDIEDDNFTANKKNARKILEGIIQLNLPLTFSAMNGLSYHSLDEELLILMKKAGFQNLNLSLVSSDQDLLALSDRPHTVEKFLSTIEAAVKLDMPVTAYYILGMPGQTIREMIQTLLLLSAQQCLLGASPFYFTPGSPIHDQMKMDSSIRLASSKYDAFFSARLTAMDLENDDFSRDDIYTLFRLTRVINSIKEGLDRQLDESDTWFKAAQEALLEGVWYFENKSQKILSPFSNRVLSLLRKSEIIVRGYRSSRSIKIALPDKVTCL